MANLLLPVATGRYIIGNMSQSAQTPSEPSRNGIGTLQETSLHAALKRWYARPGDRLEAQVDGFFIDVLREDLLIEIQTGSFSAIKPKLIRLIERYPVRLVHPIPLEKWIVRLDSSGEKQRSRRKSPKRGGPTDVFYELVRISDLVTSANFSVEILLTREEEIWRDDGRGSWRRRYWSIVDRRLLEVVDRRILANPLDFQELLPADLPAAFTTADLAKHMKIRRSLAGKMAYCLRVMGAVELVGKRGKAHMYALPSLLKEGPP